MVDVLFGMGKKKVTLSLDDKVYSNFQKICQENAMNFSKKIELMIKDFLKKGKLSLFFVFLVGFFFLISFISAAQIFYDDFESGNLNDWSLSNNNGVDWGAVTIDPFAGTYHAESNAPGTTEPASVMERIISTTGYQNVVFAYQRRLIGLDSVDWFSAEWFDGSDWHEVERINSVNDGSYSLKTFSLGALAENNANFKIKFECTAGAVSEFCRVDNVNISGNVIDNIPPNFTNHIESPINNSKYLSSQIYEFNVTINEPSLNKVIISFNGVNYTGSSFITNISNVYVFNRTGLGAGSYNYYWWANDTNGNSNKSSTRTYVVDKAVSGTILVFSHSSPQTYGTVINVSCSTNNTEGSLKLYRDGVDVTSENNQYIELSAGTYNYTCNVTETQNYTVASNSSTFTIIPSLGNINLHLNSNSDNLTIQYPELSNISSWTSYGSVSIYLNGTDITSQNNLNFIRAAGYYNVTAVSSGDQNHSSVSVTSFLTINKAAANIFLVFDKISPQTYGTEINVSCYSDNSETSIKLYRNGVEVTSSENNKNLVFAAGSHNYVCNISSTQNYTLNSTNNVFVINKAVPLANLNTSDLWIVTYGDSVSIGYNESNFGDSDVVYIVYRNGVSKGVGETVSLAAGSYNYTLNTTGGENYTSVFLDTKGLVVNKKDSSLGMVIGVNPSLNESYGTYTRAIATEFNFGDSDLNYSLTRNGVLIASSSPWEEQPLLVLDVGNYTYLFNSTAGQNYTAGNMSVLLTISKVESNATLYLNGSRNNLSVLQYEAVSVNATLKKGEGEILVYYNGTLVYQGDSPYYNLSSFVNEGIYNITVIYPETQNYKMSYESFFINVTPSPDLFGPNLVIYSPQSKTYNSGLNVLLNYSVDDPSGVSGCWYNLDDGENLSLPSCSYSFFNVSGEGNHTLQLFSNDTLDNLGVKEVDFVLDSIGVSLFIFNPSGLKTTRTGIPINYAVIGNNISACWYNIKTSLLGIVIENISLENCTNSSFSVANDGDYILTLFANNSLGSFKSLNSSFSVDTTPPSSSSSSSSSSGGGSSGGSFSSPGIKPLKSDLSSAEIKGFVVYNVGVKKILSWKVKNNGTSFLNDCVFRSFGENTDWITYSETKGLAAGEEYEFIFDVNIPEEIVSRKYNLGVLLACKETNTSASFVVEVIEKTLNFELINVERNGAESIRVDYSIEDISGKDQEVTLEFLLFDSDKKKVAELSEKRFVKAGSKENFLSFLSIPQNLEGQLGLLINVNSETYSGFVQENIMLGRSISGFSIFDRLGDTDNFVSIFLVILFLVFCFFVVRKIRSRRKAIEANALNMIKESKKAVKLHSLKKEQSVQKKHKKSKNSK